ncbi:hypothetical protein V5O48_017183 [Marasmius crinis-equi]|uniref:Uncharacterized protein n=1 Tax=Marasmius crinis-equi TaxID=585013 RepID=A0ABR3EPN7_9AGAR
MNPGSSSQECLPSSSTLVKSEYFKHTRNITIGDNANLSTVHGDQIIHYNTEMKKGRFIVGTEEEEAEYAEFSEVKRGDVAAFRTVHHDDGWEYDSEGRRIRKWVEYERTVVTGEVRIGGVASKCTVASYSGEGAEEGWKKDFQRLCGTRRPENAQLVAINLSRIPMLVLTGNLVPLAHLADRVGEIGRRYLLRLALQMGCWRDSSLWLDTSRGVFCRGPKGPWWDGRQMELDNLPLDAELVNEDVLLRYLASRKEDRGVVKWLSRDWDWERSQVKVNRPTVISTLDDTILAVGSGVWRENRESCLGERTELADGTTRFALQHNQRRLWLELDWREEHRNWLAQAPSIFHAHGISLEGDMRPYKLVLLEDLKGTLSKSKAKRRRRRKCSPIYLFFSESIFWSFDRDGQTPIPTDLCRRLGLPPSLSLTTYEYTWETWTYKTLQNYQIARKFDPTTTDFAQRNNYRIYDVVKTPLSSRFEEIDDSDAEPASPPQSEILAERLEAELEDMSLELLFGDTQPDLEAPEDLEGFSLAAYRIVSVPSTELAFSKRTWMLAAVAVFLVFVALYLATELLANLRGSLQVSSWVAVIAH